MPDETPKEPEVTPEPEAAPAVKKRSPRPRSRAVPAAEVEPPKAEAPAPEAKPAPPRPPRRATLSDQTRSLLSLRRSLNARRPIFGRQAANRYYRIGRDGNWRRPRGLQSKQRRHYGYRARIVRVGYRTPALVRGLVPSGFRPVLVRTSGDLERIDARTQAAVIARTVGTRRRLVLEEEARKLGIRVLNPIVKSESEA
jgi:large subunit ribosomal protein L32e